MVLVFDAALNHEAYELEQHFNCFYILNTWRTSSLVAGLYQQRKVLQYESKLYCTWNFSVRKFRIYTPGQEKQNRLFIQR